MRTLVLLKGPPGIGKSTFIKDRGLEQYTICPDNIRLLFQSPETNIDGSVGISQKNDKKVWELVFNLLEERMERGEFTIIDATHSRSTLISRYKNYIDKHRYRCYVLDFTKTVSLEEVLIRNSQREEYKKVPEDVILKIHARLKNDRVSNRFPVITVDQFDSIFNILFDFNNNNYERINVFGDIHSCLDPLKEYFEKHPYSEKEYYIFTGDYFDRGPQPVETFKFLQNLFTYKNVLPLIGNHEIHFYSLFHKSGLIYSKQFKETIDAFNAAQISVDELKQFYNRLAQFAYFKYGNNTYVVTHGGIPKLPSLFTPTIEYIKGVGKYEQSEEVDAHFNANTPANYFSIHGHRNVFDLPIRNSEKTFNLEGKIEFGGNLRVVRLYPNDVIDTVEIKNNNYRTDLVKRPRVSLQKMPSSEVLKQLFTDKNIRKKHIADDIFSIQHSRKAFHRRLWNSQTITARGLFFDGKAEKIVARSYPKFFNWGELPETETGYLKENFKFPVVAYRKYNGFLGILSVHKNEWFIASKTTIYGEYADMFKEIIRPFLTEELKQYIIHNDVSLVFEVIDPINDPHIIEYDHKHAVLLDVIKNDLDYSCYGFKSLSKFAETFNFRYKSADAVFETWEDLYSFKQAEDAKSVFDPNVEGWVFVDQNQYMVKYKTKFYSFWKHVRKLQQMICKYNIHAIEVKNKLHSLDDYTVYNAMVDIGEDYIKKSNLIQLRCKIYDKITKNR